MNVIEVIKSIKLIKKSTRIIENLCNDSLTKKLQKEKSLNNFTEKELKHLLENITMAQQTLLDMNCLYADGSIENHFFEELLEFQIIKYKIAIELEARKK